MAKSAQIELDHTSTKASLIWFKIEASDVRLFCFVVLMSVKFAWTYFLGSPFPHRCSHNTMSIHSHGTHL